MGDTGTTNEICARTCAVTTTARASTNVRLPPDEREQIAEAYADAFNNLETFEHDMRCLIDCLWPEKRFGNVRQVRQIKLHKQLTTK